MPSLPSGSRTYVETVLTICKAVPFGDPTFNFKMVVSSTYHYSNLSAPEPPSMLQLVREYPTFAHPYHRLQRSRSDAASLALLARVFKLG